MAATRKRKVLVWLTLFVGLLLVLISALPLWFPWILPPIARHYGLHYSAYQRQGYARFILRDATLTNRNVQFHSARIETFVPTAYLWERSFGQAPAFLQISNWSLAVQPSSAAKSPKPPYSQFHDLQTNFARVLGFIPKAVLTDGRIDAYGQTIAIPRATVSTGAISAQLAFPKYRQDVNLLANLQPPAVRIDSDTLKLHATLTITQDPAALRFESTGVWLTNHFRAGAHFSPKDFLPDKAYVEAKAFSIPSQFFSMPQFTDFRGSLSGEWLTNRFYIDVNGSAEPRVPQNLPPLTLNLRATGDTNSIYVDQAKLSAPWMDARLSERTRIQFTPPFLTRPTEFSFNLDLDRQPWFAARGQLRGRAIVLPGLDQYPPARFTLAGSGIQISNIQTKSLSVTGALHWPSLEISNAAVAFADGSVLNGQANVNLLKQEIQNGLASLNGRFGQQWLPAGYALTNAALSLQFAGPFTNLSHSGQLDIQGLSRALPSDPQKATPLQILLRPLNLRAKWRAQQLAIQELQAQISAGTSTVALQGSANLATPEKSLRLTTLDLRKSAKPLLALQQPVQVTFQFLGQNNTWRAFLTPFDWSGPGGQIHLESELDWPRSGSASALLDGVDLLDFDDFLQIPAQRLFVKDFGFAANWINGPLHFHLMFAGEGALRDNKPFVANGRLSGSDEGLSLTNLTIFSQTNLLARANGSLPITIHPGQLAIQVLPDAPLRVDAQTEPGALLWKQLAALTGVQLENPHLSLEAAGTWKAPRGTIQFQASKAQVPKSKEPLPDLEDLKATIRINEDSARVDALTLLVAKQPVSFTAETPLGEKFWLSLLSQPQFPDFTKASAHLKISQAEVAAMAPLLPQFLYPQGVLKADVTLLPGGNLDGQLSIDGAATAPLPNLGPVSGLNLVARFQRRTMNLKAGGVIGGGAVSANGTLDLQGDARALLDRWQQGLFPPFQLRVQGTNVSLVRQPELILRADLDASLSQSKDQPVLLAGTVQLRDSLYLEDVSNLIEGKPATPGQRPPYFSVSIEPLAQWQLDVKVTGTKFMRVQTPVFRGRVTSNLKLTGTLKDPVALGELTIDTGEVQFPFASLPVTQGFVSLTSADPYRPHLVINGAGQALGYDIHMEITGPADKLALQFSSTPALSSQQILLMLTTGELPRGSYTLSTQQRAQTFAVFLGRNVLTQFGFGSGTANRLTVRSGEEFTETGRPTYSVEYKLDTRWSIIGQYDRFNEYNLMLKWKAYSH